MPDFLIIQSAKIASIQDSGRYGYGHYGISVNGAVDPYSYLMGNRLVGNHLPKPSIEITAFEFAMSSTADVQISLTGATADLTVDSVPIEAWKSTMLPAGKLLSVKKIRQGLRVYISVGGGLDVPLAYGSCSPDTVARIGQQVYAGQQLRLSDPGISADALNREIAPEEIPQYGSPWTIRVCSGPDTEIFAEKHLGALLESEYTVSPDSNHIGIRLKGNNLSNFHPTNVLSRGVSIGAIEVTPTGELIILHRGRSVTAGYPIIGVVAAVDLGKIGQARPGDKVRFSRITADQAIEIYRSQFHRLPRNQFRFNPC